MGWIERYVHPGDRVVDVGANKGEITDALLRQGATVIAIEPHRDMVAQLRQSYPAVTVLHAAAWEAPGTVTLYHSRDAAQSSLFRANLLDDIGVSETVPAVTLDQVCSDVAAVKIDAQGSEAAIMRGARAVLAKRRAVFYIEIWNVGLANAGESVRAVRDVFAAAGYHPEGRTWDQVEAGTAQDQGHSSTDILVLPQEWAS